MATTENGVSHFHSSQSVQEISNGLPAEILSADNAPMSGQEREFEFEKRTHVHAQPTHVIQPNFSHNRSPNPNKIPTSPYDGPSARNFGIAHRISPAGIVSKLGGVREFDAPTPHTTLVQPQPTRDENLRNNSRPPQSSSGGSQPGLEYLTKVLLQVLEKDEKAEQERTTTTSTNSSSTQTSSPSSFSMATEASQAPENSFVQQNSSTVARHISPFQPIKSEAHQLQQRLPSLISENHFSVPYAQRARDSPHYNRFVRETPSDPGFESFQEKHDNSRYSDYTNPRQYSDERNPGSSSMYAESPSSYGGGSPNQGRAIARPQNTGSNSNPNVSHHNEFNINYNNPAPQYENDAQYRGGNGARNSGIPGIFQPTYPQPLISTTNYNDEKFENGKFEEMQYTDSGESVAEDLQSESLHGDPRNSGTISRKQFRETIGCDFARDLLSGEYSYDEIIGKYRQLYPQFADKFTRNFCSKVRCGRILSTSRTMKQRSVKSGDPRMKRVSKISKRKEWARMTPELFSRILSWEQAHNGAIKQSDIESKFNINRSTFHRWKKKCLSTTEFGETVTPTQEQIEAAMNGED